MLPAGGQVVQPPWGTRLPRPRSHQKQRQGRTRRRSTRQWTRLRTAAYCGRDRTTPGYSQATAATHGKPASSTSKPASLPPPTSCAGPQPLLGLLRWYTMSSTAVSPSRIQATQGALLRSTVTLRASKAEKSVGSCTIEQNHVGRLSPCNGDRDLHLSVVAHLRDPGAPGHGEHNLIQRILGLIPRGR
jgi:hypothetical protein